MGNDHVEPLPRQRWRNLCNSRSSRKSTYDLFLRSVHTKNIRSRRNTLKTIHTDRNNNTMNLTSRLLFAMTLAKWTTIAGGRYGTGYEFLPAIFPFIVPEKFDPSSEMVDYYTILCSQWSNQNLYTWCMQQVIMLELLLIPKISQRLVPCGFLSFSGVFKGARNETWTWENVMFIDFRVHTLQSTS